MLTPNRITYLSYLRNNPLDRTQIMTSLWDGEGGFCALGFALDALGALPEFPSDEQEEYYDKVSELLDLTLEESDEIWMMNDLEELSLTQIADRLETKWRNE